MKLVFGCKLFLLGNRWNGCLGQKLFWMEIREIDVWIKTNLNGLHFTQLGKIKLALI